MTKDERRGYLDRMRKNQQASLCPACKRKTRHFSQPSKDHDGTVDVFCEYCNAMTHMGLYGLKAYIPVRITTEGVKPA